MTSKITLSIALVTRNRPESLERCLISLRSQKVQPFEIVVSDDSNLQQASLTEAVANRWNCRYIKGPCRGLYANRNHAAIACKGTHIRTMDDDHEFPDDHFEIVQNVVKLDPNSVWIIGEFKPDEFFLSSPPCPGEIQPRGFSNTPSNPDNCFAISDGASIYPRQIFDVHCYLEVFPFGYLYLEFGARLKASGYRIRYLFNTYVIHHYISGKRSFNDENLQRKSAFLSAYLTYSFHLPNLAKEIECLGYFLIIALLTQLKIKPYYFDLIDFIRVWRLSQELKKHFMRVRNDAVIM